MIAMRPIKEEQVLSELNRNRFEGELDGYVIMDGPEYLGHILYQKRESTTFVLDANITGSNMVVDGAVRACVAAGQFHGATHFQIMSDNKALLEWKNVFCKAEGAVANEKLFAQCK